MNPQSNLNMVVVQDLTFANPIGLNKHQVVAFRCNSDLLVLESMEFLVLNLRF